MSRNDAATADVATAVIRCFRIFRTDCIAPPNGTEKYIQQVTNVAMMINKLNIETITELLVISIKNRCLLMVMCIRFKKMKPFQHTKSKAVREAL